MRKEMLCRSLAEKVTASLKGEMVSGSRNVTAHEDRVIRLMQAEQETETQMRELEALIGDLRDKLTQIAIPDGDKILYLRYVDGKKVNDIAKMLYCSARHVYRKLDATMEELEKLI